jgi:uncharacterized protein
VRVEPSSVNVEPVADPAAFVERALPYLAADEVRHNLILGIALSLVRSPARYPEHRLWLVTDGDEIVGAALQTPPSHVVVARPRNDEALQLLAAAIGPVIPGVVGAVPEVRRFIDVLGVTPEKTMNMQLLALERVSPADAVSGVMRAATAADRAVAIAWGDAFMREAFGTVSVDLERVAAQVDHLLASDHGGISLWIDPVPVSLAAHSGDTPNGVRIGPVYTPPEVRGRGYATSLVAQLSQMLLARGKRFCCLYVDANNASARSIYERIGYRYAFDAAEVTFRTQPS